MGVLSSLTNENCAFMNYKLSHIQKSLEPIRLLGTNL